MDSPSGGESVLRKFVHVDKQLRLILGELEGLRNSGTQQMDELSYLKHSLPESLGAKLQSALDDLEQRLVLREQEMCRQGCAMHQGIEQQIRAIFAEELDKASSHLPLKRKAEHTSIRGSGAVRHNGKESPGVVSHNGKESHKLTANRANMSNATRLRSTFCTASMPASMDVHVKDKNAADSKPEGAERVRKTLAQAMLGSTDFDDHAQASQGLGSSTGSKPKKRSNWMSALLQEDSNSDEEIGTRPASPHLNHVAVPPADSPHFSLATLSNRANGVVVESNYPPAVEAIQNPGHSSKLALTEKEGLGTDGNSLAAHAASSPVVKQPIEMEEAEIEDLADKDVCGGKLHSQARTKRPSGELGAGCHNELVPLPAFAPVSEPPPPSDLPGQLAMLEVVPNASDSHKTKPREGGGLKFAERQSAPIEYEASLRQSKDEETKESTYQKMAIQIKSATQKKQNVKRLASTMSTGTVMERASSAQRAVRRIVEHEWFDYFIVSLVVLNAGMMGLQADYSVRRMPEYDDSRAPELFRVAELIFCVFFTLEVALRIFVHKWRFFVCRGKSWRWNYFDASCVFLQLFEQVSAELVTSGGRRVNLNFMRIVRMTRIVRIIRVIRLLRFIKELRMMVCSIAASLRSLGWTLVLLAIMMYVVSVVFIVLIVDHAHWQIDDPDDGQTDLVKYYGSLPRSMLTLLQSITGGADWDDVLSPLSTMISPLMQLPFVLYVTFAIMAMLNVITAVFVESAMNREDNDKECLLSIFNEIDRDRDGTIGGEEFNDSLHNINSTVLMRFMDVGIDAKDTALLFRLLDIDDSGVVDVEEFISGCFRLRGEAKSMDLATLMCYQRRMNKNVGKQLRHLSSLTEDVHSYLVQQELT